jgi:hypothetical protein
VKKFERGRGARLAETDARRAKLPASSKIFNSSIVIDEQTPPTSARTIRPKKTAGSEPEPKPEKIRAELNIEKWPAIWNPTHSKIHSKHSVQSRTLQRESTGPDGTKTISQVTINPIAQLGDLTTDDQRTLYALIKHWEERGKPAHETPFSIRHLSKLLHKKGWGTNVIDAITGSLERLRGTMLVWMRSYRSKDERVEDSERVYINLLAKLKIVRRKIDGHVTTEAGYFQFDDHLLKNLLDNYTKPFLFDVFMDIRGEIALKLYSYLDLIMADKMHFERRTKDLFEDLGLSGTSYRNPSKRKQNLQSAFAELQGIMLTTGVLRSATIEKTKDGKDFKAVFRKAARAAVLDTEPETTFASAPAQAVVVNDYSKQKDFAVAQAEELVLHFHRVFHQVTNHAPQSREIGQAVSLVARYGFERAKYTIEFAKREADKTQYAVQHFGATLSYASRAAAEFDRLRQGRGTDDRAATPAPTRTEQPAAPDRTRGKRRLAILTAEQRQARVSQARAQLLAQQPFLERHQERGSQAIDSMVLERVVRRLDEEPMDIMPPGYLPGWLAANFQTGPSQNLPL